MAAKVVPTTAKLTQGDSLKTFLFVIMMIYRLFVSIDYCASGSIKDDFPLFHPQTTRAQFF